MRTYLHGVMLNCEEITRERKWSVERIVEAEYIFIDDINNASFDHIPIDDIIPNNNITRTIRLPT